MSIESEHEQTLSGSPRDPASREFSPRISVLSGHPDTVRVEATERLRIVVVDDHEDTAAMMSALLRLSGHEVETAHDGRTAVAAVECFKPDVVLLDLGLPDMDGYEIARRLRQMPCGQQLLLIALTGYTQAEHVAATRRAGFDHHLTKPVDLKSVGRLIARSSRPLPPRV